MASIRVEKGTWKVKDSEGNITKLYPAGKEIDSVSGSQLVIEDSRAGALRINKTYGKSEQRKTTGAQLFDASKLATTSAGGATVTNNGDGSFTVSGSGELSEVFGISHSYSHEETLKFLKAGTLLVDFGAVTYPYCSVKFIDSDNNTLKVLNNSTGTSHSYDITGETLLTDGLQMSINIYGQNGSTITPGTIKPMLYFDGDSDGTWEPYTGNMPAPNPQYPQEIVSTGDSGSIETKVIGNNLLSLEDRITNDRGLTQTIANGICTVSGTATSNAGFNLTLAGAYARTDVILTLPAGTYTATDCVLATYDGVNRKTYTNTFTVTEPLDITWVATRTYRVEEVVSETTYPMINVGDSAMTWEVYNEQMLSINTPNGLPGIEVTNASLANYIDADGKMWVCDTREWERGVDVKRVLLETITLSYNTASESLTNCDIYKGNMSQVMLGATSGGLSSISKYAYNQIDTPHFYFADNATSVVVYVPKGTVPTEITLLGILATPIETPIPEEEMAAWRTMHSNEPTTTILSDADVEVEYPTSRVGAVALDADMRSRENEVKIENVNDPIFIGDYTTETAVDFDNLIESGSYDFNAAYITSSLHKPIAEAGTLTVKHGDTTGYVTHIYQSRYGNVFVRFYNNSAWSDWVKIATVNTIRLDDVSLLSIVENGKYYIVGATDAPSGLNGYLDVHNYPDDPDKYRKLTWSPYNNGNVTYQNILVNGAWYGWTRMLTTSDFTDNGETLVLNWL